MDFNGFGLVETSVCPRAVDRLVEWVHKPVFCCGVAQLVLVGIVVMYKELLVEGRPFVASLLRVLRRLDG